MNTLYEFEKPLKSSEKSTRWQHFCDELNESNSRETMFIHAFRLSSLRLFDYAINIYKNWRIAYCQAIIHNNSLYLCSFRRIFWLCFLSLIYYLQISHCSLFLLLRLLTLRLALVYAYDCLEILLVRSLLTIFCIFRSVFYILELVVLAPFALVINSMSLVYIRMFILAGMVLNMLVKYVICKYVGNSYYEKCRSDYCFLRDSVFLFFAKWSLAS